MKNSRLFFIVLTVVLVRGFEFCDETICKRPNCQCPQTFPPISGIIPQLVALSFDDAIVRPNFENYYKPLLFHRKNADNCSIGATFFVPHEYTDYTAVHELYLNGFQIGSNSITKNYSVEYWANATRKLVADELGGQRDIIAKFAAIPREDIVGSRIPQFQINGDETYLGLKDAGFLYDSSWPTPSYRHFFTYTLDHAHLQECIVGKCPVTSIPGFWMVPVNNWATSSNTQCNNLQSCGVSGSKEELFNWMKMNFEYSYLQTRAPVTILLNSAWFMYTENSFEALQMFLDYLDDLKDVFVVSEGQIVEWAKNPVTTDKYNSCRTKPEAPVCTKAVCILKNFREEERVLTTCLGQCPNKYPWIGNTNGE